MQNNEKSAARPARLREKLVTGVRLLVLVAVVWFVVQAFRERELGLAAVIEHLRRSLTAANAAWLALVALLTPVNWALEALKWRELARKIQPIGFGEAFRGVLAGLSLGLATPANLGDYAGRIGSLKTADDVPDRRLETLGGLVVGNAMQFYVALLAGTLSGGYFLAAVLPAPTPAYGLLLVLLVGTLAFGLWVAARRRVVPRLFDRFGWLRPFARYVRVVGQYSATELTRVFGWAVLRHAVFTGQFLLMLLVFNIRLPLPDALCGVSLVFLAKTVVPAFHFLSDLGVREFTALYFFGYWKIGPEAVVSATLALWVVNILLPAAVGTGYLLRVRLSPARVTQRAEIK